MLCALIVVGKCDPITGSYGIPLRPSRPEVPIQDINLPEQPTFVIPQEEATPDLGLPVVKPHFLRSSRRPVFFRRHRYGYGGSYSYGRPEVPAPAPFVPIVRPEPETPIEDINLPESGAQFVVPPEVRAIPVSNSLAASAPVVQYTSDPIYGYRVISGVAPVQDTPEVAAAKTAFFKTYNEVLARNSL